MRIASERFAASITQTHLLASRVALVDTDGNQTTLDVLGGSVTLDGTAATRGNCSIDVAPIPELVPDGPDDDLAPYGNELWIWRGITYPEGTVEEILLGKYRVDSTEASEAAGERTIQVSGLDRSSRIIEPGFETAGQVAATTTVEDAIEAIVTPIYPDCTFDLADTGVELPLLTYQEADDVWQFCSDLASAAQCDLYFDAQGTLVMLQHPQLLDPDLIVAEGEGGSLLSASKRMDRADACNRVTVSGESSGNDPAYGEAHDDDPASPTYWKGPFGTVTFRWSSEYVTSDDQAEAVAANILRQKLGISKSISFDALTDPRLEPNDVVQLKRESLGINELHIIDSIQLSLTDARMSCETRKARVS